jgi:multiple sugar transport system substrate-binding protein
MEEIITSVMADEPELSGFVWPGTREESLVMFYATALHAFGGSYTDEDGNLQLDTPESVRAVEWMRSTITRGLSPRSVQNWQRRESRQRFVAGEALFSWDNQDIITWLDDPEQSQVSGAWDFIPFPAQPEGRSVSVTGGFAFSVNPYSDDVDAAMKVLEVISSEKVQKGFALAWGPVQYYRGLYDDPEVREYNPNVEKLAPLVEIAINRPPSPNYGELSGILQEELNAAVTGTKSPEEAVRRMAERAAVLE